jgi:hypothetical protein
MKTCSHCNLEKPLTEFWKNKARKDGLQRHCKICTSERKRIESSSAASKETRRKWIEKNPDKIRQYSKNWHANNKEKATKWQREHPEYQVEQSKKDIETLSNKYIKTLLSRQSPCRANLSSELIEAKRLHIQIIRKLKELKT